MLKLKSLLLTIVHVGISKKAFILKKLCKKTTFCI